jgi:hypothetical protein
MQICLNDMVFQALLRYKHNTSFLIQLCRYAYTWWKEKVIVSEEKRKDGLCPLTPEETVLVLRGLGYDSKTQIYIAAGEIYGSERRMAKLRAAFPNVVSVWVLSLLAHVWK